MWSTTSATTLAPMTVGAPTVTLPSALTSSTRSNVTDAPFSAVRRSICSVSPAATRYCLLPVSKTAYINLPQRGADKTRSAPGCQRFIWEKPLAAAGRRQQYRRVKLPVGKGFALLTAALLCGCSTFNRDWKKAAQAPPPADSIAGRWEGRWESGTNHHSGSLRCLVSPETNGVCQARFRAAYGGVFHFNYTVPLEIHPHFGGWEINGQADLRALGG